MRGRSQKQANESLVRLTCDEPLVVPPGPRRDVFSGGAAEGTQRTGVSGISADNVDQPEPGELSPEVHLLLRGPDDKRDVAVLPLLRPHLKGRSFQDVSVYHRHRADEAPFDGEVKQVVGSPGRVLLPRDGLEDRARGFNLLVFNAYSVSLCRLLR